jgi:hypothetical protein
VAYTVNWVTKVITIPASDLVLVSGLRYRLEAPAFTAEIRRLEWEFGGGLWAEQILERDNTRFDFSGVDYAPFEKVVNGYTIEFVGGMTRVDLLGSNCNIADVLIANGVTVVPSNSAGNTSQVELLRLARLIPAAL